MALFSNFRAASHLRLMDPLSLPISISRVHRQIQRYVTATSNRLDSYIPGIECCGTNIASYRLSLSPTRGRVVRPLYPLNQKVPQHTIYVLTLTNRLIDTYTECTYTGCHNENHRTIATNPIAKSLNHSKHNPSKLTDASVHTSYIPKKYSTAAERPKAHEMD